MTHAAGDTGWVAWTNTVDAQIAANAASDALKLAATVAATTYVPLTDARLTDARTPTAHTQTASTIADFTAAVNALIGTTGTPTGVAYSAGWADYGSGFSPATWYKDKDGWIRLSGTLKRTGSTITGAASGTIFTLPVGARPAGYETFVMNKDAAVVFCNVGADGIVQVAAFNTWTSGASYMYLGGCQFKAA